MQLLREQIGLIHTVLYTHEHADHLFGLDDLRIFANYLGHDLPVYCDENVEDRIRKAYDYAFDDATRHYPAGGLPKLVLQRVRDRADRDPGGADHAHSARTRPLRVARLPLRQRGLLHRYQRHPGGEPGVACRGWTC